MLIGMNLYGVYPADLFYTYHPDMRVVMTTMKTSLRPRGRSRK